MNNKVYYQQGGGDEQYTPKYGVEILLPYIQHHKDKIIWCPFDKEDSQFVQVLAAAAASAEAARSAWAEAAETEKIKSKIIEKGLEILKNN